MRRVDVLVGALTVAVVVVLGEAPLVAVIAFLVIKFGLWGGFLIFSTLWGLGGILLVPVYDRVSGWFSCQFEGRSGRGQEGLRRRWIAQAAQIAKPFGALVNSVFLGPIFGIPVFRALGYQGLWLYVWVLVGSLIFGAVWILGVYGRLATVVIGG